MNAPDKYMDTFITAIQSFRFIGHTRKVPVSVCGPKELEGITSYNKAKIPIHNYIKATKKITDKIFEYIKFNDEGGFDDKSVEKSDLLFLFLRPIDSILDEEKIEPVEEALINTCTYVDIHYTYTANMGQSNDIDNDSENDSDIELQDYGVGDGDKVCQLLYNSK